MGSQVCTANIIEALLIDDATVNDMMGTCSKQIPLRTAVTIVVAGKNVVTAMVKSYQGSVEEILKESSRKVAECSSKNSEVSSNCQRVGRATVTGVL